MIRPPTRLVSEIVPSELILTVIYIVHDNHDELLYVLHDTRVESVFDFDE